MYYFIIINSFSFYFNIDTISLFNRDIILCLKKCLSFIISKIMIIRKVILNYFTILTKVKLYVNVNTRKVHEKYIFLCI